ncbi:MAG: hypothetical protein WA974_09060 [Thermodesulfobacteriota bacterium]
MSYILEALKKVEQKRMQEESPESLALLGTPESGSKKRLLWPYPVMAALILNAGVMLWWIGPWRAEKKNHSHSAVRGSTDRSRTTDLGRKNKTTPSRRNKRRAPNKERPQNPGGGSKINSTDRTCSAGLNQTKQIKPAS